MEVRGADRYKPEKEEELVKEAEESAKEGRWNGEAAAALLRLWRIEPGRMQTWVTARLLTNALAQLPDKAFRRCLGLLPERALSEEPLASLAKAAGELDRGAFKDFWEATKDGNVATLLQQCPAAVQGVRRFACWLASKSYARAPMSHLEGMLNLSGDDLKRFLASSGFDIDDAHGLATPPHVDGPSSPIHPQRPTPIFSCL